MKVEILGAESLGVRSFCTYLETRDVRILIDPGCALGVTRFNLPPHRLEILELWHTWDKIRDRLKNADVVIVTHYHHDHHHYRNFRDFSGKVVLLKEFVGLNKRQRIRGDFFYSLTKELAKVEFSDGKIFRFGNTKIAFSEPLGHGYKREEVKVVSMLVEDDLSSVFYSSDVSGSVELKLTDFLRNRQIETFIFDGFPVYLLDSGLKRRWLEDSNEKLINILERSNVKNFIIDHHSARDISWQEFYKDILSLDFLNFAGTAARFQGLEEKFLEARRKELFSSYKPFPAS